MDIKGNSLYAQMQHMAVDAGMTRNVANVSNDLESVQQVNKSSNDFGDLLADALNKVNDLQQETGAKRRAFELGDDSVTLADTMIASAKSGVAFDAAVQVRNKFVEAYKEIMSMPV